MEGEKQNDKKATRSRRKFCFCISERRLKLYKEMVKSKEKIETSGRMLTEDESIFLISKSGENQKCNGNQMRVYKNNTQ